MTKQQQQHQLQEPEQDNHNCNNNYNTDSNKKNNQEMRTISLSRLGLGPLNPADLWGRSSHTGVLIFTLSSSIPWIRASRTPSSGRGPPFLWPAPFCLFLAVRTVPGRALGVSVEWRPEVTSLASDAECAPVRGRPLGVCDFCFRANGSSAAAFSTGRGKRDGTVPFASGPVVLPAGVLLGRTRNCCIACIEWHTEISHSNITLRFQQSI